MLPEYDRSNQIFRYSRSIAPKRVMSWRGNTASFEKMWLRWRAVGNTVSDLTGLRFEPHCTFSLIAHCTLADLNLGPPAPETNALSLDQQIDQSHSIFSIFYLDSSFM